MCVTLTTFAPGHEGEPFEQGDILLVLQQRAIQRRDDLARVVLWQRFVGMSSAIQQLEPVEQFGRGRFLLQARQLHARRKKIFMAS